MTPDEMEVRVSILSSFHDLAVVLLTAENCEPDTPMGRIVRRWAQRAKWRLIDDHDPALVELAAACNAAVDRAFHPDRELEKRGFVLPALAVARSV